MPGRQSGFTPATSVGLVVDFIGTGTIWNGRFPIDNDGEGTFDFTPFIASCARNQAGFDITAYNQIGEFVTATTLTTVPCP